MRKFAFITVAIMALALLVVPAMANAQNPPDTAVLKAKPGDVKFDHKAHVGRAGADKDKAACDTCHKAIKEAKAANKVLPEPFHIAMAKSGLCIDCHKKQTGKPVEKFGCTGCHKKA